MGSHSYYNYYPKEFLVKHNLINEDAKVLLNPVKPPTVDMAPEGFKIVGLGVKKSKKNDPIAKIASGAKINHMGKKIKVDSNLPSYVRANIRLVGENLWEDPTLAQWDPNDHRIFCGDLGNEVSEDTLRNAFRAYPSLQRARVIRDKKTHKSKGFGFLSFKDPKDYMNALKEMNGKYVGSRPIKLSKSTWKT
ncbi:hypothetical protein HZS_6113, partial [Henneguya salminicola]